MRAVLLSVATLAGSLLLLEAPWAGPQSQALDVDPCVDLHRREPVLIRDETGAGFAGDLRHTSLVVYSDGFVALSENASLAGPGGVATAMLDPTLVAALREDLLFAGGASLCDQPVAGNDLPLTTVSLFHGRRGQRCRTFSYYLPEAGYGALENRIDAFVATHFSGFPTSR